MRVIKIGRYTFLRHWFRWYSVHTRFGGSEIERTDLLRLDFKPEPVEE